MQKPKVALSNSAIVTTQLFARAITVANSGAIDSVFPVNSTRKKSVFFLMAKPSGD
jgi:hypothetical protein